MENRSTGLDEGELDGLRLKLFVDGPSAFTPNSRGNMIMDKQRVIIFDTTLRDGEQSPGASLSIKDKVQIAIQLERLGVDIIEAGFPVSSPVQFEAVEACSDVVKNAAVCGLARTVEKDITSAWKALKNAVRPRIHTFIATSPIHMEFKLHKNAG